MVAYSVNGVAQSFEFDTLGRITSASNALDTFTYSYTDGTPRVSAVTSNTGPTIAMTYFGPTGDELLQQMNVTATGERLAVAVGLYLQRRRQREKYHRIRSQCTDHELYVRYGQPVGRWAFLGFVTAVCLQL